MLLLIYTRKQEGGSSQLLCRRKTIFTKIVWKLVHSLVIVNFQRSCLSISSSRFVFSSSSLPISSLSPSLSVCVRIAIPHTLHLSALQKLSILKCLCTINYPLAPHNLSYFPLDFFLFLSNSILMSVKTRLLLVFLLMSFQVLSRWMI